MTIGTLYQSRTVKQEKMAIGVPIVYVYTESAEYTKSASAVRVRQIHKAIKLNARSYVACHKNIALMVLLKYIQHTTYSVERTKTMRI